MRRQHNINRCVPAMSPLSVVETCLTCFQCVLHVGLHCILLRNDWCLDCIIAIRKQRACCQKFRNIRLGVTVMWRIVAVNQYTQLCTTRWLWYLTVRKRCEHQDNYLNVNSNPSTAWQCNNKQKTQLSHRDRAMFHVTDYFAKSVELIWNNTLAWVGWSPY